MQNKQCCFRCEHKPFLLSFRKKFQCNTHFILNYSMNIKKCNFSDFRPVQQSNCCLQEVSLVLSVYSYIWPVFPHRFVPLKMNCLCMYIVVKFPSSVQTLMRSVLVMSLLNNECENIGNYFLPMKLPLKVSTWFF